MVTKNQIKLIKSLQQKKARKEHKLFVAEGVKVIEELLASSLKLYHAYVTEEGLLDLENDKITLISSADLKKMSSLTTAANCLAVFYMPEEKRVDFSELVVALDDIRDPGNLGTIIRLCDWFGVKSLLCSMQTVDVFNAKVIQATMGSIARVNVVYGDLHGILAEQVNSVPVYGAFLEGEDIYQSNTSSNGVIVMGNEANGISSEIEALVSQKITIPRFGDLKQTESLNVAMATSILLSEFKRKNYNK